MDQGQYHLPSNLPNTKMFLDFLKIFLTNLVKVESTLTTSTPHLPCHALGKLSPSRGTHPALQQTNSQKDY